MSRDRPARVGQLILQLLGNLQTRGFKDPRLEVFFTFTGIEVSPDLKHAKVFWTVHGDEQVRKQTKEGLQSSVGFIKKELGRELKLRHTPDIHFAYDEAIDRGERIETLLAEIKREPKPG